MQNEKIKPSRFLTTIKKKMLLSVLCLASLSGIALNVHEHNEINQLVQNQEQLGIQSENTLISVKVYYKGKLITNHTIAMTPDEKQSTHTFDDMKGQNYLQSILTDKNNEPLKQFSSFETGERITIESRRLTDNKLSVDFDFASNKLNSLDKFKQTDNAYVELPSVQQVTLHNRLSLTKGNPVKISGSTGGNTYEIDLSVM